MVEVVVGHPGALDVHRERVVACARLRGEDRSVRELVEEFGTTARELLRLRDWLAAHGVERVAMEATGVYWKPVWAVLEDDFELVLANPREVRHLPGRKSDLIDARWLCQLLEAGLVRGGFVPPRPIRELRLLTRYRRSLVDVRSSEARRLHKTLDDAGVRLGSVVSDIRGQTARVILRAMCDGESDPAVLAGLARGSLRDKTAALRDALVVPLRGAHRFVVAEILDHLDRLDERIARLEAEIDVHVAAFADEAALLCSIDGVGERAASVIIAECGTDMRAFPSARHFASWCGFAPGKHESAGRQRRAKATRGPRALRTVMYEVVLAALRRRQGYLYVFYCRIKQRSGHRLAVVATANTIMAIIWHLLRRREPYRDLGTDYFDRRHTDRLIRRLQHRLDQLHALSPEAAAVEGF